MGKKERYEWYFVEQWPGEPTGGAKVGLCQLINTSEKTGPES